MKEKLLQIFNALRTVDTRGDSTVIMADCLKALAGIIQELEQEKNDGADTRK